MLTLRRTSQIGLRASLPGIFSTTSSPATRIRVSAPHLHQTRHYSRKRSHEPQGGTTTPLPKGGPKTPSSSPFYFESAWSGWPKRLPRPFPPPFFSPPSGSFSDPLSTHDRVRGDKVNGELIRGRSVGDDAVISEDNFIGANDGVGQWAQKERGCAPLWSRLILHFWLLAAERDGYGMQGNGPEPVRYLDEAYTETKGVLTEPNHWEGTTTCSTALLHFEGETPVLFVTQLGDSRVLVIRPKEEKVVFSTEEQWHFFDCPRQLGTNSIDTPYENAVMTRLEIQEDDVVLAMSDGVTDNLWEHEICTSVVETLQKWRAKQQDVEKGEEQDENMDAQAMKFVARELVDSARKIAEDMFAESPFMERAVEEGLPYEGGKLDDISVVAGLCRRRTKG
ncbi:hypothetical protein MBLNU230_g4719t1 [Neophaeotheca triangularis]